VNPLPLLAIASVNPFLWFYLNEARPYVMQYGAACVLCAFLFEAAEDPARGIQPASLWMFVGGLLVLCGSSLLGVFWAAFAGAAWLFLVRNQFKQLWHWPRLLPLAVASVCLAGLGVYYLWTIRAGGRASSLARTGLLNLGFVLYELVGAAGLGPGRLELRQHPVAPFRNLGPLLIPFLAALALSFGLLGYAIICAWRNRSRRSVLVACIYAVPPSLLLFVLGYAQNFRVLGRHFMPLLPVILGLIAFGFSEMRRRRLATALLVGLLLVWLGSSLSLRFAPRHRKDDYRAAADAAKDALAQKGIVWWSADRAAAVYYGIPLGKSSDSGVTLINGFAGRQLTELPAPDVVIASKPDIFDPAGELGNFLREQSFAQTQELPAFKIWRRPDVPAPR
jgi:hypothetical protein